MNPDSPEMKFKNSAIKNLIAMLDDKILEAHQVMRSKEKPDMKMDMKMDMGMDMEDDMMDVDSGKVMGEAAEEAMMNEQPMDMDMKEGDSHQKAPLDMNQVVHEMNKAEDNPAFDVDNKEIRMSLDDEMNQALEENAKYRPRMRKEEKGNLFTTKRMAKSTEPMPQQSLRKKKYR